MTLTTTPASASADSYAQIADADTYAVSVGATSWTASVDTTAKEAALRRATFWLDGNYRSRYSGMKRTGRAQALEWPRAGATDREEWPVDPFTIPPEVVRAVCEAAFVELTTPGVLSPSVTPAQAKVLTGVKGITWTPLRTSAGAVDMAPQLLVVDRILSGLLLGGDATTEVVRA